MQVDTSSVKENALFLFNPLPWPRKAVAEVIVSSEWKHAGPDVPGGERRAEDRGAMAPVAEHDQFLSAAYRRWSIFPRCGYKVFELMHGEAPVADKYADFFQPSHTGFGIASLKANDGTELLAGPIGLVAIRDTSDTWAHDIAQFRDEIGRPTFESASSIVEDGPLTRITRHRARWQDSEIVLNIRQIAGLRFGRIALHHRLA